ncbi:serine protease [Ostreiculturibacter nitratireducens]|uniref:serine protease n=1 Tax=Ostreiculturibacter nitratireducens TaxID=3075226 RepID=UPI0031B61006
MTRVFWVFALTFWSVFAGAATAQQSWVQIEALSSLSEAEERARAYAAVYPNVSGFTLPTGWYAIALGPFTRAEATQQLRVLSAERLIPPDSFVSDGRRYQRQFWPAGATLPPPVAGPAIEAEPPQEVVAQPEETVLAPVELPEETPSEARASEAALSAEERMMIQTALSWFGYYNAGIDGAFGRGTRFSMAAWQEAEGLEPTGVLTTRQRTKLLADYRTDQAALGLETYRDDLAGIEVQIPMAMVRFDRYEPPFAHFTEKDGSGVRILLISQHGDETSLYALYDIMQTLEIVPLEGARERQTTSFTLTGQNDRLQSYTQAELRDGMIKGFTLVWRPEDTPRADKVMAAMKSSFAPIGDRALGDVANTASAESRAGLLSGLEVREPVLSRTGFYVDAEGTVLTTSEVVAKCGRVTIDGVDANVALTDPALGLAVLKPAEPLAPASHATLRMEAPRPNSEIAVAGYSYEGALTAPVMTFGSFAEAKGLQGEDTLARLALAALPGDAGGPVFDTTGAVLGMLLPRSQSGGRVLPAGVGFAVDSDAIAAALTTAGVTASQSQENGSMAPEDLTQLALGMTVLVSCWE